MNRIEEFCNQVQESLVECFWSDAEGTFVNHFPARANENWIYWWHAHSLDCLLDAYLRTNDQKYLDRIEKEYRGTFTCNGNTFLHNWYDDMEWMALAQLRLWDATKEDTYKDQVLILWEDIKTAWNDNMGGGLAWKKDQLDYKNTPANAPAAILAFRLYQRFRKEDDLLWGKKILDWNLSNLTDPMTGFVWDGINRLGDKQVDYEWNYTYNQGVVIGALVELYRIEPSEEYVDKAVQIAKVTKELLIDSNHGIIPYEGEDDCGLFKGILVRYLYDLIEIHPQSHDLREMILHNARCVVEKGINEHGLIGGNWEVKETANIDLAQHLSGIMLLEVAAKLINRV
jgi:predicted alpha-1,6-mannanase (GH76 family)